VAIFGGGKLFVPYTAYLFLTSLSEIPVSALELRPEIKPGIPPKVSTMIYVLGTGPFPSGC